MFRRWGSALWVVSAMCPPGRTGAANPTTHCTRKCSCWLDRCQQPTWSVNTEPAAQGSYSPLEKLHGSNIAIDLTMLVQQAANLHARRSLSSLGPAPTCRRVLALTCRWAAAAAQLPLRASCCHLSTRCNSPLTSGCWLLQTACVGCTQTGEGTGEGF